MATDLANLPDGMMVLNPLDKGSMADTHAQKLLAALVGFIQPIVYTYIPSSAATSSPTPSREAVPVEADASAIHPASKDAGNKLLTAFQEFILDTVNKKLPVEAEILVKPEDPSTNFSMHALEPSIGLNLETMSNHLQKLKAEILAATDDPLTISPTHTPEPVGPNLANSQPFHLQIKPIVPQPPSPKEHLNEPPPTWAYDEMNALIPNAVRAHVYNKMPVRLLAFSQTGSDIELLDRGEIHRRVLRRAHASVDEFVREWPKEPAWKVKLAHVSYANKLRKRTHAAETERIITNLVSHCVRYAILSHTWIRDLPGDVVFQDWATRAANERGYSKISRFCAVAAKNHGVGFGWMDTVCIDKASSSELDESIRSMYKWYRNAHVCIAYLSETSALRTMGSDSWFTRGWTLQELLAPQDVRFYNEDWVEFLSMVSDCGGRLWGVKDIQDMIQKITSITPQEEKLCRLGKVAKIPLSRKLSLAAQRQVTRQEDQSYSVMGLLGVDISIAYGEGPERAFTRLIQAFLAANENIFDVFNYGNSVALLQQSRKQPKLVPYDIRQYKFRDPSFDTPDGIYSSLLDQWIPHEPVLLTHMGVRVPVLLASAVDCGGVHRFVKHHDLVGNGNFTANIDVCAIIPGGEVAKRRYQITAANSRVGICIKIGILNFTVRNNTVILPERCLAIPLQPFSTSNNMSIIPTQTPVVFKLKSLKCDYTILREELAKHGLTLDTLHL